MVAGGNEPNTEGLPPERRRGIEATQDAILAPVLEMAIVVARQGESDIPRIRAPQRLRPFLTFARLPAKALTAARFAVDNDSEFRARVAHRFREAELDTAAWAWLTRSEGWLDTFDAEVERTYAASLEESAAHREADLQRDLDAARAELTAANATIRELQAQRDEADSTAASLLTECEHLREQDERVAVLEAELSRAIKDLKSTERLLATRVDENKRLLADLERAQQHSERAECEDRSEGESASFTNPKNGVIDESMNDIDVEQIGSGKVIGEPVIEMNEAVDAGEVTDHVARAAIAAIGLSIAEAAELAARMAALLGTASAAAAVCMPEGDAEARGTDNGIRVEPMSAVSIADSCSKSAGELQAEVPATAPAQFGELGPGQLISGGSMPGHSKSGRNRRRRPLRPRRGLVEGSAEAVEQLFNASGVVVLVDGYNASLTLYPHLDLASQREALLRAFGELERRTTAEVRIVFDGDGAGGRPNVVTPLPVRVEFTDSDTEADDRIIELAAQVPHERHIIVVTADRRICDAVTRVGANVIEPVKLKELLNR